MNEEWNRIIGTDIDFLDYVLDPYGRFDPEANRVVLENLRQVANNHLENFVRNPYSDNPDQNTGHDLKFVLRDLDEFLYGQSKDAITAELSGNNGDLVISGREYKIPTTMLSYVIPGFANYVHIERQKRKDKSWKLDSFNQLPYPVQKFFRGYTELSQNSIDTTEVWIQYFCTLAAGGVHPRNMEALMNEFFVMYSENDINRYQNYKKIADSITRIYQDFNSGDNSLLRLNRQGIPILIPENPDSVDKTLRIVLGEHGLIVYDRSEQIDISVKVRPFIRFRSLEDVWSKKKLSVKTINTENRITSIIAGVSHIRTGYCDVQGGGSTVDLIRACFVTPLESSKEFQPIIAVGKSKARMNRVNKKVNMGHINFALRKERAIDEFERTQNTKKSSVFEFVQTNQQDDVGQMEFQNDTEEPETIFTERSASPEIPLLESVRKEDIPIQKSEIGKQEPSSIVKPPTFREQFFGSESTLPIDQTNFELVWDEMTDDDDPFARIRILRPERARDKDILRKLGYGDVNRNCFYKLEVDPKVRGKFIITERQKRNQ